MKRWMFRIVFCLLLGVVTTVGVAVLLARYATAEFPELRDVTREERRFLEETLDLFSMGVIPSSTVWHPESVGAEWKIYEGLVGPAIGVMVFVTAEFGWPLPAAGYQRSGRWISEDAVDLEWLFGDIVDFDLARNLNVSEGEDFGARTRPFPDGILPLGFVVDTLFYAIIWFTPVFGIGSARRSIRRKRGRCVKCGYDLRGTPDDVEGCSECGWNRDPRKP